jgi:hypothetical protein
MTDYFKNQAHGNDVIFIVEVADPLTKKIKYQLWIRKRENLSTIEEKYEFIKMATNDVVPIFKEKV